ncbi:MAG: hypothetical protein JO358_23115 [Alphaproteobacteria bacterium]|nr:hypothetical protein [Alphaproteobacteria bacterium]
MGIGHERFDYALDAWASDFRMSECNHLQFYRRWVQLMAADRQSPVATNANGGCEATR